MSLIRHVKEGTQHQGVDEQIVYTITTTPWGSTPTSPTSKIFSYSSTGVFSDTTSTNMTGSCSVAGDIISLPLIKSLVADTNYRVETQFTISGNLFECYFNIQGER